jgi:hypothetical protein
MKRLFRKSFPLLAFLLFLVQVHAVYGAEGEVFPVGSQLPSFTVGVPESAEVQKYLGLKGMDPFKVSDIGAKIVVIEFMSAM